MYSRARWRTSSVCTHSPYILCCEHVEQQYVSSRSSLSTVTCVHLAKPRRASAGKSSYGRYEQTFGVQARSAYQSIVVQEIVLLGKPGTTIQLQKSNVAIDNQL